MTVIRIQRVKDQGGAEVKDIAKRGGALRGQGVKLEEGIRRYER